MKFTPETLLQIYLDGSFTDEAQAEFDRRMRQDPLFAEKVIQAVSERLGPVPDPVLDGISGRLEGKAENLWRLYKPSPVRRTVKLAAKGLGIAVLTAGLYFGFRHLAPMLHTTAASNGSRPAGSAGKRRGDSRPSLTFSMESNGNSPRDSIQEKGVRPPAPEARLSLLPKTSVETAAGGPKPADRAKIDKAKAPSAAPWSGEKTTEGPSLSARKSGQIPPALVPAAELPNRWSRTVPESSSTSTTSTAGSTQAAEQVTDEGNSLRVAIDTGKTQKIGVTILDSTGLLVRRLYEGVVPAGEHYVDWDGRNDAGKQVLPGDYTVVLDLGDKKMSGILKVLSNP